MNLSNYGIAQGRVRNYMVFENTDGSKTVKFKVASPRNYKNKEGNIDRDFVEIETFIDSKRAGNEKNPWLSLQDEMLISVQYEVKTDKYTNKNGDVVYPQIHEGKALQYLETKKAFEARLEMLKGAKSDKVEHVEAEIVDDADLPF